MDEADSFFENDVDTVVKEVGFLFDITFIVCFLQLQEKPACKTSGIEDQNMKKNSEMV